jgi:hypothetical protein
MDHRKPNSTVLVCPCCASPVDAVADPDIQDLTCGVCDQVWQMVVDPLRIAQYALT